MHRLYHSVSLATEHPPSLLHTDFHKFLRESTDSTSLLAMAEIMHRTLSAKLRSLPSHRSSSFRKSVDWNYNEDSSSFQQSEDSCAAALEIDQSWVVRWRAKATLGTLSPYSTQKVVIDIGMTTSYRREGPKNCIVGAEIFDLLWNSKMFANEDDCRGWFIDELEIKFEPLWCQEEIVTGALYPKTVNAAAYFGNSTQMGVTGFVGRNPTVAVNMSKTRSQQTSQQMYTCRWERGLGGVMILHWKLNLWCPSSKLEYPKLYNPRRWSGSKVPRLPADYEKGNFNGLDFKPRVEWVVPASVVRAGQASWRVTTSASLTCVRTHKYWFFATDKYFHQEGMQSEEIWRFPGKSSEDWWRCNSRSGHHSCRGAVLL